MRTNDNGIFLLLFLSTGNSPSTNLWLEKEDSVAIVKISSNDIMPLDCVGKHYLDKKTP